MVQRAGAWVLTAAGAVTAAGHAAGAVLDALRERRVPPREPFDAERGPGTLALVPIAGFDPSQHVARKGLKHLSRTSQLAVAAAAGLVEPLGGLAPERVGVALGSAWATLETIVRFERAAHVDGLRFVDPSLFAETVANVPAGQVSIVFGWSAFNATFAAGPASGLAALEQATSWLADERADVAVAGGSDELNRFLLMALAARGDELPRPPRVAGEGACLLAIEAREHARRRGARPVARLAAVATASEATIDSRRALAGRLLDAARLAPEAIDLVILAGEPAPDARRDATRERWALRPAVPLLVPADLLGETWAAAGPLAVALAAETVARGEARAVLVLEAERGEQIAGAIVCHDEWEVA